MGCGEMIAADEPTIVTEHLFDASIVKEGQDYGCLPNPAGPDQSDWCEVLCETDDPLDQIIASKEVSRR